MRQRLLLNLKQQRQLHFRNLDRLQHLRQDGLGLQWLFLERLSRECLKEAWWANLQRLRRASLEDGCIVSLQDLHQASLPLTPRGSQGLQTLHIRLALSFLRQMWLHAWALKRKENLHFRNNLEMHQFLKVNRDLKDMQHSKFNKFLKVNRDLKDMPHFKVARDPKDIKLFKVSRDL